MSAANKELYAGDEIATKAARSVLKADIDTRLAVPESRLGVIEKPQWVVVAGVIGLLIKAFI